MEMGSSSCPSFLAKDLEFSGRHRLTSYPITAVDLGTSFKSAAMGNPGGLMPVGSTEILPILQPLFPHKHQSLR